MFRIPDFRHHGRTAFSAATIALLSTQSLMAHPGHGSATNQTGVLHYVTSPMHVAPALVLIAVSVAAIRWISKILHGESK